MKHFQQSKVINYNDVKTSADQIATFYAYTYDLYFDCSLKYLKEKKYLDKFADRVKKEFESEELKKQVDIFQTHIEEYINKF